MIAYVKVVDSPYFSKTDAAGVARIELPAGAQYTVSAWHFNMTGQAATQALSVKAGEASAELAYKLALKPPVDADTAPSY